MLPQVGPPETQLGSFTLCVITSGHDLRQLPSYHPLGLMRVVTRASGVLLTATLAVQLTTPANHSICKVL